MLGPDGATSGLVRLVQFDEPGELYWGDYSHMQDYGHYAMNIRVPEINAAIARITSNGGRAKSEPTHWTVTPELSAWDSLSYDPDGNILLDVFELEPAPGSPLSDYDGRPTSLQTVAIHSSDARAIGDLLRGLGLSAHVRQEAGEHGVVLPPPRGHEPAQHQHDVARTLPTVGRLEIAQYVGWPGVSQRDRAVPPALGILSASLQTDDLAATEALLSAIGTEPVGERVEVDMPGLGAIAARSYFGPDDEVLEFFERL